MTLVANGRSVSWSEARQLLEAAGHRQADEALQAVTRYGATIIVGDLRIEERA